MTNGKQRHTRKQKELERANRRRIVSANLLAGLTYRQIADALDVSLGTIAGDCKAIVKDWREQHVDNVDDWAQVQLRRLDIALNAIWDDVRAGKLLAIDRALKIMERQAKLLGLDKPIGLDLKTEGKSIKITTIEVVKDYGPGESDDTS